MWKVVGVDNLSTNEFSKNSDLKNYYSIKLFFKLPYPRTFTFFAPFLSATDPKKTQFSQTWKVPYIKI